MKALKSNPKEFSFYNKLKRAAELVESVLNEKHSDRHGTYIAFNCKVYGVFDVDDLRELIRDMKLSFRQTREVLQEFDSNERLENIFNHQLQRESDGFKDLVAGSCYVSKAYVQKLISKYSATYPSLEPIAYPDLRKELKKVRTLRGGQDKIAAFFKESTIGWEHTLLVNSKEVFQFGRSGGWMALAEAGDFEEYSGRIDWCLKNRYQEKADGVYFLREDGETRNEALQDVTGDCDPESIIAHCQAILFFLREGKERVKHLNGKQFLRGMVLDEVRDCLSQMSRTFTIAEELKFIEGKANIYTNMNSQSMVRKSSRHIGMIETSQGVKVPISEGISLYEELTEVVAGRKPVLESKSIGGFHIESFSPVNNDWILKAGCHKISFGHLQRAIPFISSRSL